MPEYLSPGVYVKEVASSVKPIAGVSTSTAGFIGVIPDELCVLPAQPKTKTIESATVDGIKRVYDLEDSPVCATRDSYQILVDGKQSGTASLQNINGKAKLVFPGPPARDSKVTGTYQYKTSANDTTPQTVTDEVVADKAPGDKDTFDLDQARVVTDAGTYSFKVDGAPVAATLQPGTGAGGKGKVTINPPPSGVKIDISYQQPQIFNPPQPAAGSAGFRNATLCTNFTEYTNAFGPFSCDPDHRKLTHAVYGFFNNGGTRCYVVRLKSEADIDAALSAFELVDEIAMVAAPGLTSSNTRDKIVTHCSTKMGDRFAILDGPGPDPVPVTALDNLTKIGPDGLMPSATDYAAWYFPWIKVFDPVAKKCGGPKDGIIGVPPSGHIAGIYARVDNDRGVHKAPANEPVRGALDVTQRLSKAHQDVLNPKGVNCIRVLNDNILVWGARTIGGDDNQDLKYINVRRTLLFLRKSIDEGTQWVVFEPNSPALWQKISRNVTSFLTNVWRSGALFGNTPEEAFYVKCDKESNPQSSIDVGEVVTEIGVAIVRPAEFVIFRISQMAGAGA
jgi:phage tail sheath protein FI